MTGFLAMSNQPIQHPAWRGLRAVLLLALALFSVAVCAVFMVAIGISRGAPDSWVVPFLPWVALISTASWLFLSRMAWSWMRKPGVARVILAVPFLVCLLMLFLSVLWTYSYAALLLAEGARR